MAKQARMFFGSVTGSHPPAKGKQKPSIRWFSQYSFSFSIGYWLRDSACTSSSFKCNDPAVDCRSFVPWFDASVQVAAVAEGNSLMQRWSCSVSICQSSWEASYEWSIIINEALTYVEAQEWWKSRYHGIVIIWHLPAHEDFGRRLETCLPSVLRCSQLDEEVFRLLREPRGTSLSHSNEAEPRGIRHPVAGESENNFAFEIYQFHLRALRKQGRGCFLAKTLYMLMERHNSPKSQCFTRFANADSIRHHRSTSQYITTKIRILIEGISIVMTWNLRHHGNQEQ